MGCLHQVDIKCSFVKVGPYSILENLLSSLENVVSSTRFQLTCRNLSKHVETCSSSNFTDDLWLRGPWSVDHGVSVDHGASSSLDRIRQGQIGRVGCGGLVRSGRKLGANLVGSMEQRRPLTLSGMGSESKKDASLWNNIYIYIYKTQ